MGYLRLLLALMLVSWALGARANQASFDAQFLDTMAAHQKQAVELAKLAVEKSESGDIGRLAQKMRDDEEADVADLRALRDAVAPGAPLTINLRIPGMKAINVSKLRGMEGGG